MEIMFDPSIDKCIQCELWLLRSARSWQYVVPDQGALEPAFTDGWPIFRGACLCNTLFVKGVVPRSLVLKVEVFIAFTALDSLTVIA